MLKKISYILLIILFTSCSSLQKNEETNIQKQMKLVVKLDKIKEELKQENFETLNDSLDVSFFKRNAIEELLNYDISNISFYYTKPVVYENFGDNTIGFRFNEEVVYFDVIYKYQNENWKIIDFKEKR